MNVSKPRPSDHPLVIIFVVGGVTPSEVRLVKDTVTAKSSATQVSGHPNSLLVQQVVLENQASLYCCTSIVEPSFLV